MTNLEKFDELTAKVRAHFNCANAFCQACVLNEEAERGAGCSHEYTAAAERLEKLIALSVAAEGGDQSVTWGMKQYNDGAVKWYQLECFTEGVKTLKVASKNFDKILNVVRDNKPCTAHKISEVFRDPENGDHPNSIDF